MKYIVRISSLLILVSTVLMYTGCDKGDDNKKSEQDQQIEKLVGTWKIQNATLDGVSPGVDYTGFTLTISGAKGGNSLTFTAGSRPNPSPWPASGTFTFGSPVTSELNRDDGTPVIYAVNANSLQMTLQNYNGQSYTGRTSSVAGTWIFSFTK